MNARQYAEFYNEQAKNDNIAPYFTQGQVDSFSTVQGTDWQDAILRNAPQLNNVLTVSGGNAKTRFSISGGIFKQQGIVRNSDYNRYTLRANIDQEISSKFTVNYSTTLTRIQSARQNSGQASRGSSLISAMQSAPPTLSPSVNGYYRNLVTAYPFISNVLINPVANVNETSDALRSNRILANVAVIYKPVAGLSIKISGGIENEDFTTNQYSNGFTAANAASLITTAGSANVFASGNTSLLNENIITYTKAWGDHSLTATTGFYLSEL